MILGDGQHKSQRTRIGLYYGKIYLINCYGLRIGKVDRRYEKRRRMKVVLEKKRRLQQLIFECQSLLPQVFLALLNSYSTTIKDYHLQGYNPILPAHIKSNRIHNKFSPLFYSLHSVVTALPRHSGFVSSSCVAAFFFFLL